MGLPKDLVQVFSCLWEAAAEVETCKELFLGSVSTCAGLGVGRHSFNCGRTLVPQPESPLGKEASELL
jgi:hypothetical protein